jgi:hypothetical protein
MNRNKIEKWILSQEHCKHPNIIFGLTILSAFIISIILIVIVAI